MSLLNQPKQTRYTDHVTFGNVDDILEHLKSCKIKSPPQEKAKLLEQKEVNFAKVAKKSGKAATSLSPAIKEIVVPSMQLRRKF